MSTSVDMLMSKTYLKSDHFVGGGPFGWHPCGKDIDEAPVEGGRDVAPDRRETELELKTGAIMIRFDWRQFEPDEDRRPQLINRYNEHMRDPYPWRRLV